jgi:hypothetical protein
MSGDDRGLPTRRAVLGGALGAGAVAPLALPAAPASAATAYRPARVRRPRLLKAADRHLVSRFSYGVTPALAQQVRAAGGARGWFEQQLSPASVSDPGAVGLRDWWRPGLSYTGNAGAAELWRRQREEIEGGWEVMANYARWALARRILSRRQVLEVMCEFWENHFNVPVNGDAAFTWRTDYGMTIRAHALGSFASLLRAAILHPAMGIYLNNAVSKQPNPNENLGRELLELHTVGRTAGYTEDDVKNSARILTGYRVRMWQDFAASYRPEDHWTGPVTVLGRSWENASPDGRQVAEEYLDFLARHPATARRIARKLCVKFVSDRPSDALVERLARVYLDNKTQIKPVLRALVASAEFQGSVGKKVRDPGEDVVATYRLLRVALRKPTRDDAAANAILWQVSALGSSPFSWPRPDGQPLTNEAWSSPSRMLASMDVHFVMSGGWWPTAQISYRSPLSWAGKRPIRFDRLVDKLSREILHKPSTAALLDACCKAVGVGPRARITADHGVVKWDFARLLTTFFDSPDFYLR